MNTQFVNTANHCRSEPARDGVSPATASFRGCHTLSHLKLCSPFVVNAGAPEPMSPIRLFVPLALALLAACTTQPAHNVTVEKQSECPVQLNNGQNLILTLPSNPTTGYRWAIQDSAGGVLHALGPEVYRNPEDAGIVGAAGVSTWRFQAFATGTGRLRLTSQQPWAPEVLPVDSFDCAISVN
ncbi:inhibitor of cysteine peptidase [Pseudomonas sp. GV085]|nr:inhibitor of cysteine peptidase [Pseudomonas sp. GV085]